MGESLNHHQKAVLKVLAFVGLCVLFFLLHIQLRTLVVTKGFAVAEQRAKIREFESKIASLRVQRERLMGPASLERLAESLVSEGSGFERPDGKRVLFPESPRAKGASLR